MLLVIDVGSSVNALAFFVDPATGAPRLACGFKDEKVRVFDPVAGGEALLVIDVACWCTRWRSLRTRRRARRGSLVDDGKVRVFDPVAGGEALVVIDVGSEVLALAVFADPATGELRIACGSTMGRCAYTTQSRAARRGIGRARGAYGGLGAGVDCFRRPGDGRTSPRERIGGRFRARLGLGRGRRGAVRARGTPNVNALTAFADPATGETRLASGS